MPNGESPKPSGFRPFCLIKVSIWDRRNRTRNALDLTQYNFEFGVFLVVRYQVDAAVQFIHALFDDVKP